MSEIAMLKKLAEYQGELDKKDKVIEKIKNIIENEFEDFTSHSNNFNLGDMQLLEDIILDKINEKVEEEK